MYRRFWRRCGRLPLFRLGGALIVLSALIDTLDALLGLDLASLVPGRYDPGKVVAAIGAVKIALRFVFMLGTAFAPKGDQ